MRHPHRNSVLACQTRHTADVVTVFVGDKNRVEFSGIEAQAPETVLGFFQAKAAIEQHSGGSTALRHLDDQSIALTARP